MSDGRARWALPRAPRPAAPACLIYIWIILGKPPRFGRPHTWIRRPRCRYSVSRGGDHLAPLVAECGPDVDPGGRPADGASSFANCCCTKRWWRPSMGSTTIFAGRAWIPTNSGSPGARAFLEQVQESMSVMPEGSLIAGIVVLFGGADASLVESAKRRLQGDGATHHRVSCAAATLATFGERTDCGCMAPRRIEDATAVAGVFAGHSTSWRRCSGARRPGGLSAVSGRCDAAFFRLAARNTRQEGRAANRGSISLRVVDE